MVDIPIERVDPPLFSKTAIQPDVVTNRTPFEGRVFVLVMDDLNTKFSLTPRTRAAARQFVERYVGANDIVAVVNTSGYGKSMQDFTSNRQLALKAIDEAMGNKADSSTPAALQDYYVNRDMPGAASNVNASFNEMQRYNNARNSMRTLKNLADFMAGMRGRRKAVVFFSEGVNYNVTDPFNNPHATDVQREIRDLVAAATRANVNVYSVDPRGVTTGMEDAIEMSGFPADGSIKPTDLMAEMRLEQDSLRVVADETGGFAVLNQNDFRNGFSRILEDNSSYYVLGYYPTNDKLDGRFRNVQVKVLEARPEGPRAPRLRGPDPGEEGHPLAGIARGKGVTRAARRAGQSRGDQRADHQRVRRAVQGGGPERRHRDVDRGRRERADVHEDARRAVCGRARDHIVRGGRERQDQGRRARRHQPLAQAADTRDRAPGRIPRDPPHPGAARQVSAAHRRA